MNIFYFFNKKKKYFYFGILGLKGRDSIIGEKKLQDNFQILYILLFNIIYNQIKNK